MSVEKYLTYRGAVRAIAGIGGTLAFVTRHAEGRPTGLYRLDADALTLDEEPLPRGGVALVADGEVLWVAAGDGRVYQGSVAGAEPRPIGPEFPAPPTALAPLAEGRLAVLAGSEVVLIAREDGRRIQALELPEPGTCLAADPTGRWLAAGTAQGTVAVFDAEGRSEFLLSETARLHEGAVSALLFEPDELRFFSAGADGRLLSTHARGKLEPEDKGRGNNHTDLVTALIWGPGDRLYSGSRDGTIKSWPRVGAVKPATVKDGVGKVVALALVHVHDRPRLAAACDDDTLRFFALDAAGKIGELTHRVHDAYARAGSELSADDPRRREAALRELAGFGDARAVERIANQVQVDTDHALRLMAARLLGESDHPRAATVLEPHLSHADEAVRVAALEGLRRHFGPQDLRPLDLALKAEKADVGRLAIGALEELARRDDRALARLLEALEVKTPEVRQAALEGLERIYGERSPEADLIALGSRHADLRKLALVRLYRRGLFREPAVQTAVRRRFEDGDAEVSRVAFLLAIATREPLARVLRARDPDLQRQLAELDESAPAEAKAKPSKARPAAEPTLEESDLEPLLQATASRSLGTCLRGAAGLAVLRDPRALGLLLQLSREAPKWARVAVCRALAALDDPRAVERLRSLLHDGEVEVRDAAFTALARIHQKDPLRAAESGLNASFEDVRRRGLKALIAEVRREPLRDPEDPSWRLLARTLNDGFESVRSEAFKAALNLQVAGGGPATLRFAQRSIHADIRREVLTEVMARIAEPWGWDLLLAFFNDPEAALRGDAFAFAVKKTKGLESLEAGLASRYVDVRKQSVEALVKKHTKAAQALLVRALDDEEREVRLAALESLVGADARPDLARALDSPHADVRLRAAKALARHGDPAALAPLLALGTAPEPAEKERRPDWADLVESALDGLGELGDPAALTAILPKLDSPDAPIRRQAARALIWVTRPESLGVLREALSHADPAVKYHAALGLAYHGDTAVAPLVFSGEGQKVLSAGERLAAGLTLGAVGEDWLVIALDDPKDAVRERALLLLMVLEWKAPQRTASRGLAALASRLPRVRLIAAQALESLSDPDPAAFAGFVARLVNDRGDNPPGQVPAPVVAALAELLVHAPPLLRARTARLLRHLRAEEPSAFDLAWSVHAERFAGEIAALGGRARTPAPPRSGTGELRQLAFGAYVGLVREQGETPRKGKAAGGGTDPHVIRVRQTALSRLLSLARGESHFVAAAMPVFVQVLGDPNQAVRLQAFEQLQALGADPTVVAAEALATGHTDLGVKGLELLSGGAGTAQGQAALERALLERRDDLALEAAKLLAQRRGRVAVAGRMLEAAHEPLRRQAVGWLAGEADTDEAAGDLLRRAMTSRHPEVREAAALALGTRKDPAAFEVLSELLKAAQTPPAQRRVISALVTLGDPRTPDAFLDRLEDDPGGTALADDLLTAAGGFRRPENADRLIRLLEKERRWRDAAFAAVLAISGYDQPIADPEDDRPDRRQEGQFPRRDDVLARLMERCAALGEARLLTRLIPAARWARGREVEPVLAGLVNHPDDGQRRAAIEALGWRLRKRQGDPGPLLRAVAHRDPISQFLAAEALAKAGRREGLSVLLASAEFVSDLTIRRRAVLALGELADERALETLLRLAGEDGHALQDEAAEAIGHLGRTDKAEEIFKLLERLVASRGSVAEHALKGLRWLDTRAGWQLLRERAADEDFSDRGVAVEMLGDHDDPATRDLLLRLLSRDKEETVIEAALEAAGRLWGPDALEPGSALLRNEEAATVDGFDEVLDRVARRGEPQRLFEVLPGCPAAVRKALATSLLNRPSLPLAEARAALDSPDAFTAGLAAHVLGRAGEVAAGSGPAVEAVLKTWWGTWQERRQKGVRVPREIRLAEREGRQDLRHQRDDDSLFDELTECVRSLAWTAGRLGIGREALIELATARPQDDEFHPIRREAVLALAAGEMTAEVVAALEAMAQAGDPEVRALAAQALAQRAPERATALAERLLSDRASFDRLARHDGAGLDEVLRDAARQVHYQGVALPYLIQRSDVVGLAAVATDRTLPEVTRLGAVEGLAALGLEPAEEVLRRLGSAADEDEELRKAAWRALRRSKRVRRKRAPGVEVQP